MNLETNKILSYIDKSGFYLDKVYDLRKKHNNIKDFQMMFGYVVMEILNENKEFIHLNRNKIELPELAHMFFERNAQ